MTVLPTKDAVVRFDENESRFNTFVNETGTYTTNSGLPAVETLPSFMARNTAALNLLTATNVRGDWAATTVYSVWDEVKYSGTWYRCVVAHTSTGSFDSTKWRVSQGVTPSALAQDSGSNLIGFTQAGTGAVNIPVQSKLRESVSIADFGASPSATAEVNDAAILAAVTHCKTLVQPRLTIPSGEHLINNTAIFDLPNYSTIDFIGSLATSAGTPAVRIGSNSENRFGYIVTGLKVRRLTTDSAGSSVGVQLRNIVWSYVDIRSVTNFRTGVLAYADKPNGGVSYNEVHLGQLHDNRTNLHLQANGAAGGYTNENVFYGGSYNHSSGYPSVTTINIFIDYDGVYRNNNNRFFCPSLEDNSVLAQAAVINGDNNVIFHPRLERPTDQGLYKIQFTAASSECAVIGNGFAVSNSNIDDLGVCNSYVTRTGHTYKSHATDTPGEAVFSGQSAATSLARIFSAKDTGGVERAFVRGNGEVVSLAHVYSEKGFRFATTSGTRQDRGVFVGAGSPVGVISADMGSLYVNTLGGAGVTLWVKESGAGNTGWRAI